MEQAQKRLEISLQHFFGSDYPFFFFHFFFFYCIILQKLPDLPSIRLHHLHPSYSVFAAPIDNHVGPLINTGPKGFSICLYHSLLFFTSRFCTFHIFLLSCHLIIWFI